LIGVVVIGLLMLDPDGNLPAALWLLIPMALVLYGTALIIRFRQPSKR
jgi:hypothetical protein